MKLFRIFAGSLIGAFCSAMLGAVLCWIAAFTNPASWYLGPIRNWAPVFALAGAIYGLGTGFVLGLLIGALDCGKRSGGLLGVGLGLIVAAYFVLNAPPNSWDITSIVIVIAFVPLSALSGVCTAIFTAKAYSWLGSRRAKQSRFQRAARRKN